MSKYFSKNIDHVLTLNYEDAWDYITNEYTLKYVKGKLNDLGGISSYKGKQVIQFYHSRDNEIERVRFEREGDDWIETEHEISNLKKNE